MTTSGAQSTISDSLLHAGRDNHITNTYNDFRTSKSSVPVDVLAVLQQYAALGALHDAAERPDPPKCHPGTRTLILDRIDKWARDKFQGAKPIFWLFGAAGAGKSAIAQTLIERWRKDQLIIPNFFFWRTALKRNQKIRLVPTFAFQLAKSVPEAKAAIEAALPAGDTSIFEQNLTSQVEALIVQPLKSIDMDNRLVVMVIDGLDECCVDIPKADDFPGQSYEDQQGEILAALCHLCHEIPSLRVLVTSRPERRLRISFARQPLISLAEHAQLGDGGDATADITNFLDCSFAEIRERDGISPRWPSRQQITQLVQKSSGQFIYPSTVVKYILRRRQSPINSLQDILALQSRQGSLEAHPLAELDALYTLVLESVSDESLPIIRLVLGLMCYTTALTPLKFSGFSRPTRKELLELPLLFPSIQPQHSLPYLEKFLLLREQELAIHLTDLHSILAIPKDRDQTILNFCHATFSEYLQDKSRSGDFCIGRDETYLECSLLLLKHANHYADKRFPVRYYRAPGIAWGLSDFCYNSPPNLHLMKGLWSLCEDCLGEYSSATIPETQSFLRFWLFRFYWGIRQIAPFRLKLGDLIMNEPGRNLILDYLMSCAIPELEPSTLQRLMVIARLKKIQYNLNSHIPFDLPSVGRKILGIEKRRPLWAKGRGEWSASGLEVGSKPENGLRSESEGAAWLLATNEDEVKMARKAIQELHEAQTNLDRSRFWRTMIATFVTVFTAISVFIYPYILHSIINQIIGLHASQ